MMGGQLFVTLILIVGIIETIAVNDSVNIDLRTGIVKGYSRYVSFIVPLSSSQLGNCARQTLFRLDLSGPFNIATFILDYDRPKLWTFHVSSFASADGHDTLPTSDPKDMHSSSADLLLFNRQLRVEAESNVKVGVATNEGPLFRIADGVLYKGRTRLSLTFGKGKLQWAPSKGRAETVESSFLFGSEDDNVSFETFRDREPIFVAVNRVVAGNWRNGSGLCNVNVVLSRQQDDCLLGTHACDKNAICKNTHKSHKCICKKGFEGDGRKCRDKDECRIRNGGCVHLCHNTAGNYSCGCLAGFVLDVDGKNCIDVDECKEGVVVTGCQQRCVNTIGNYECQCNEGFSLASDGRSCIVGSWCKEQGCEHGCDITRSSYVCTCRPGYILAKNAKNCSPTCQVGNGGCQHRCTTTSDGPICTCHHKYILGIDRRSCSPSCSVSNGGCEKRCHNMDNGVRCSCPNGLLLHSDEKSCLDIDECAFHSGGCSFKCLNNFGSYECICPSGFKLLPDEKTCTDVDECTINGTCDHKCVNTLGGYECHCGNGYEKYGVTHCGDFNECSVNNGGCQHNCVNTPGSYECRCHNGFYIHPNERDCIPTATCLLPTHTSAALLGCQWKDKSEICLIGCKATSELSINKGESYIFQCGHPTLQYGLSNNRNAPVKCIDDVQCLENSLQRQRFIFTTERCNIDESSPDVEKLLIDNWKPGSQKAVGNCAAATGLRYLHVECSSYRKMKHQLFAVLPVKEEQALVKVELEMQLGTDAMSASCDAHCLLQRNQQYFQRVNSIIRKTIDKQLFYFRHDGKDHQLIRNLLGTKEHNRVCVAGYLSIGDKCILCHPGSYYDLEQSRCIPCPPGTYQNDGGQLYCNLCPSEGPKQKGIVGAKNVTECGRQCTAGHFSNDGFEPCLLCPFGTYQSQVGRTSCTSCNGGLSTKKSGSTGFRDCEAQVCNAGNFFHASSKQCKKCPIGTYQPRDGRDHCISCPVETTTDDTGSTNGTDCKSVKCGGFIGDLLGVLESPNYPGDYPSNVQCTWKISPGKGRRILVVVPEVFLADDKCADYLVMRKSHSPYSVTTFQTCKNEEQPLAFSARSKKLWIRFKSDGKNNAKGFRIPYVLYNDEYRPLIEDIVRDNRLYATTNHRQILKDWKLLGALMDVIAHPINYYKYANASRLMFPNSFIRLMTPKVRRFFSYR